MELKEGVREAKVSHIVAGIKVGIWANLNLKSGRCVAVLMKPCPPPPNCPLQSLTHAPSIALLLCVFID